MSSQNATRHGLNSVNIIINSPHLKEDQSEYDLLVAALIDELEPRSQLQTHFVYKIANCHWRYRRLINAETAYINTQSTTDEPSFEPSSKLGRALQMRQAAKQNDINWGLSNSIPHGDTAHILSRYEWRLSRELQNSYKLLRQLQTWENRPAIKKSQNEPTFPKPTVSQQPTPPPLPAEHMDQVLNAIQTDQPLPPEPKKINPVDGFISAMEIKYGLS